MAAGRRHVESSRDYSHRSGSSGYEIETSCGQDRYDGGERNNRLSSAGFRSERDDRILKSEGVREMEMEMRRAEKRKFSSVFWDKEDANVRVSSKYGTSFLCNKRARIGDVGIISVSCDLNDVCDDVDATDKFQELESLYNSDVEFRSAESTITESPTLSPHRMVDTKNGLARDVMQVYDAGRTSSLYISKSRWASDDDALVLNSFVQNENGSSMVRSAYRSHSSPKNGEVRHEDSVGGKFQSLSDDDRENDRGVAIEEDYNDSKGDVADSCIEDEDEETIKIPRNVIWDGCRSVFDYEKLNKINEGTYGVVYRARDKKTGEIVALKKVKLEHESEGFPITALREINLLMSFDHPSLVRGKEIVMGDLDNIFVVMDYAEHDLKGVLELIKNPFSISEVKCLMLQLLEGIKFLHDNWVIHRDLKSSNILFNNQGELKICDFGMARQYANPLKPYTASVVTLWYRAPEILFAAKPKAETVQYSEAVDMWSVGCIMAELLSKQPLFQGKNELDQINKIAGLLGTPNDTVWPGFSELPYAKAKFVKQPYNLLRKKFPVTSFTGSPALSDAGFDLLNRMLTYDPTKRITAHEALNHRWFGEVPLAKDKEFMPTYPAQNEKDRTLKQAPRCRCFG